MAASAVEARAAAVTGRRGRTRRVLVLAVASAVAIAGVWKLWELRRYRRSMNDIQQEIRAGRPGHAARKLANLLAWKPNSDEASYLLGVCEKARGQAPAAFGAWERVSPGSPFGARAIQGRMELLIERGRLADAESMILRAMSDPRGDGAKLGLFLGLVYSLQGRIEDRQRVIEACWDLLNEAGEGASEQAILLLRLHIQTPTAEEIRAFLDPVARSAADDDRVWLGRARVAVRERAYDEAARWLDACLRRRPEDVAVWRARLDWALAFRRLDDVRQSLEHLPAGESRPGEVEKLTAWLAAFRGDLASERRALERLVEVDPADLAALDRLVAIAEKAGEVERAGEYRGRKAEIGGIQARFETLYRRNQTLRDARELGRLAERLGRPFEAKVFRTIAMKTGSLPGEPFVATRPDTPATRPQSGSLADLVAEELAAAARAGAR